MEDLAQQEAEFSIEELEEYVTLGKELEELRANPIFAKIITEGYLTRTKNQMVKSLVGAGAEEEKRIIKKLSGIGALENFLGQIEYNMKASEHNLKLINSGATFEEM